MGGVKTLIPNSRYQVMPTAADTAQAADEWNESDHDRAKNGQFGAGGGGHTRNETSADDRPAMTEAGHRAKELVPDATHFTNPARAKAIGDGSHDFSKSSTRTWQGAGLYLFPGDHPGRDNFGEAKLRVKPDLRNPFIGNTADVEKKVDELKKTFQPPVFRLPDGSTISGPDGEPLRAYTDTAGPNADLREAWLKAGHDGIIETGGDGKAQTIAVFHPHSLGEIDGAGGGGGGGSAAPAPEGTEAATFTHDPGHEGWQFGSGVVPHKKSDIVEETPLPLAKLHSELKSNNYNAKPVQGVQDIPVRELHAWQGTIQPDKLRPLEPGYPPIEVAKLDGKYIIRNGNHRAVSGFVQGADTIKANLTDFDDPKNHKYRKAPPAAAKDALGGDDPDEADGETATAPVDDYVERVLAADAAEWKETDHPRDKSGKFGSGGGGGAATGGGETAPAAATERTREAATRVPDADKAWVARRGSAKAMKAYATKALEEGHDPAAAIAKIKDLAGKEVHGAVADYANQLIDHIAAAHGIDAHQHGRATKRDGGGGGTPEPAPPPPDPDAHRREQEARLHAHVTSFAATVPDAPEAWVAKRASARQMKALVTRALEEHSPPLETIAKLKQLAGGELHGKVEQYANQLIDHMGQAWQTDFSSHRAARRRQDAAPTPRPQPQPQPQPKPSPTPEPDKGKLPQKIGDVIKERGHKWIASEKDFHERSWAHATPELLGAMRNTLPLTRVKFEEGGRAHYNYPHEIKMDSLKDTGTWRHEYGHAIDWNGAGWGVGRNNASYRADGDRAREADTLMGQIRRWQFKKGAGQGLSYKTNAYDLADEAEKVGLTEDDLKAFAGPRLKAQQAIMEVLVHGDLAHVPDVQRDIDKSYTFEGRYDEVRAVDVDNSQFQDFIGAMTKERFGSGHGVAYYNKVPAFQTAEMFAQYVSLTSSANGKVYKKLLKAIAPKTTDHFDDILAERGGATIKKGA
jgi:hypothetical protein